MIKLPSSQQPALHAAYRRQRGYFPLIGAVIEGTQAGNVYVDRAEDPTQVYVEHAFGFAQVFGDSVPAFERALQRYWLVDKAFPCAKVRLYAPEGPAFLENGHDERRAWRQRFKWNGRIEPFDDAGSAADVTIVKADAGHMQSIERAFQVFGRFWRTSDDFARRAMAVLALVDGKPSALCYAAAVADGKAEIDVMTLPTHRQLGLGRSVVRAFNRRCAEQSVLPLWDCFTNNASSMALARSAGFVPLGESYPFYTINR
jgi:RimJ/RimL family protein N-acetyltransferase